MRIAELQERVEERLAREREDLAESKTIAPNSYGAGYDQGVVDALQKVLNTITGDCPENQL